MPIVVISPLRYEPLEARAPATDAAFDGMEVLMGSFFLAKVDLEGFDDTKGF